MIDSEELAICRRRGHGVHGGFDRYWSKCKWCGIWVREVKTTTIEEREDEPPASEQNPLSRLEGR
jgi:hypothetical protein